MTYPRLISQITEYEEMGAEPYSTLLERDFGTPTTQSKSYLKLVWRSRTLKRFSGKSTEKLELRFTRH